MYKLTHFSTHFSRVLVFANEALKCQSLTLSSTDMKLVTSWIIHVTDAVIFFFSLSLLCRGFLTFYYVFIHSGFMYGNFVAFSVLFLKSFIYDLANASIFFFKYHMISYALCCYCFFSVHSFSLQIMQGNAAIRRDKEESRCLQFVYKSTCSSKSTYCQHKCDNSIC